MPAPSPSATPGAPVAAGRFAFLKKIPTPVWLGLAGVGAGLAYVTISRRNAVSADALDAQGIDATAAGDMAAEDLAGAASPVAYVTTAAPASEPAETVGAVGQTSLETLAEVFGTTLSGVLGHQDTQTQELQETFRQLIAAGKPPVPPPPGTVHGQPQNPGTSRPSPRPKGGITYHGKRFSGALRIIDKRRSRGIEGFTVVYAHGRQRWHYDYQGAHKGAFRKVSEHWGEHNR